MASIELVRHSVLGGLGYHASWLKKDDQGNIVDAFNGYGAKPDGNGGWVKQDVADNGNALRFYPGPENKMGGKYDVVQSYPGTQKDIDATWQKGVTAGQQINQSPPSYWLHEIGNSNATLSPTAPRPLPAMNSNSVARTLGNAMGLKVPESIDGNVPGWDYPIPLTDSSAPTPGPRSDAAPPDPSTYFSGMFGDSPIMVAPMAQVMYGAGGSSGITSLFGQPDGSGAGFDSTAQLSGSNGGSPDVGAVNDNTLTNDNSLSSDTLSAGDWAQALA